MAVKFENKGISIFCLDLYAAILEVPRAVSSNGDAFASHNDVAEPGEEIETGLAEFEYTQSASGL